MSSGKVKSLRLPVEMWVAVEAEAKLCGQTVNGWLVETARRRLMAAGRKEVAGIPFDEPAVTRPSAGKPWSDVNSDPMADLREIAAKAGAPHVHNYPSSVSTATCAGCGLTRAEAKEAKP